MKESLIRSLRMIYRNADMELTEALAALLFNSKVWSEEDPRPSKEVCRKLAVELLAYIGG